MKKLFFLLVPLLLIPSVSSAQSVDLLWQADTYTPPFYKGRALWSNQSGITFVAVPTGLGNPSSLNYRWTRNGTVLGSISGVGRNTMKYSDSILGRAQNVSVDIVSPTQEVLASASVSLRPITPSLLIYENNPLYGFMFHNEATGGYEISDIEVTFSAFPLFFTAAHRGDPMVWYEWRTNTGARENANSAIYRVPEGSSGTAQISAQASTSVMVLQEAAKSFSVRFGNN